MTTIIIGLAGLTLVCVANQLMALAMPRPRFCRVKGKESPKAHTACEKI